MPRWDCGCIESKGKTERYCEEYRLTPEERAIIEAALAHLHPTGLWHDCDGHTLLRDACLAYRKSREPKPRFIVEKSLNAYGGKVKMWGVHDPHDNSIFELRIDSLWPTQEAAQKRADALNAEDRK